MADLIGDVKSKLQTTSMSDVASGAARTYRKVESGLQSGLQSARKFVSDRTPESVKSLYREARGYTTKRSQTRSR